MKLIGINKDPLTESKAVPGLLRCQMEYEVKSARGQLDYGGPKFAPEMWHQVLSFFRWTQKEMQSESQVRLYVNHQLGRWGAWAFPQAARTGMSARELPVPETPAKARERFAHWNSEPSDDWLYFGTVHHHCAASAFQSLTDQENEQNQDGLHLTAGRMDAERHDVHARLYLGGHCFEPDLSLFWPIESSLAAMVPPGMLHELARFQMGEKVTVDFPDAWRANLILEIVERPSRNSDLAMAFDQTDWPMPSLGRVDEALEEIHHRCVARAIEEEQWLATLSALSGDAVSQIIIEACLKHEISPDELLTGMTQGAA
jgi:hypothetical protein